MKPVAEGSSGSHRLTEASDTGSQGLAQAHTDSNEEVSRPPRTPPHAPEQGIPRFVRWAQQSELVGEHFWSTRDDLPGKPIGIWEMYEWHCRDENTTPLPSNMFAHWLRVLGGKLGVSKREVADYSTGSLIRWTAYFIPEAKPLRQYWLDQARDHDEGLPQ